MKLKFYRDVFYFLLECVQWIFMRLPYRVGFSFGGAVGKIVFHILPKEKKRTLSHLRMAFGNNKSEHEIRQIGEAVFQHYGQTFAEILLIDKIIPHFDEFVTAEGYENFDKALTLGKGIVVAIAHFGNWEMMGGYTALKGYPCTVIARKIYFKKYDNYIISLRNKMKVQTIYRDESVRKLLAVLRQNRLLGFVVDQDVESVDGVFVNFFNRPAFTPTAPVRFAMTTGAAIVPVFMIRDQMQHRMVVEPAIGLTLTGNKDEDVRVNTQKWVDIQEKYIRLYPHLWVWNHRRWKTSPSR